MLVEACHHCLLGRCSLWPSAGSWAWSWRTSKVMVCVGYTQGTTGEVPLHIGQWNHVMMPSGVKSWDSSRNKSSARRMTWWRRSMMASLSWACPGEIVIWMEWLPAQVLNWSLAQDLCSSTWSNLIGPKERIQALSKPFWKESGVSSCRSRAAQSRVVASEITKMG